MENLLNKVYYNPESSACFATAQDVSRVAKVPKKEVEKYLSLQETYTLHRKKRIRFPRNKITTAGIDVDWQSDLVDLRTIKKQNKGHSFILIVIDVLSRYAFARILKRKTPDEVSKAFVDIVKTSGRKCWKLTTDRGKEYSGRVFQAMLKHHDIAHVFASSPDVKCAIAERYIRTIKNRMWRFFHKNKTVNYVDVLQSLVKAINNSHHRTIGCAPSSVTKKNESEIWEHLYSEEPQPSKQLYKAGEKVRISKEKGILEKGYRANYSEEIFIVKEILNRVPTTYKLCDTQGEEIEGVFYNEELVRVVVPSKLIGSIKSIIKSEKRKSKLYHFVSWLTEKTPCWVSDKSLSKNGQWLR